MPKARGHAHMFSTLEAAITDAIQATAAGHPPGAHVYSLPDGRAVWNDGWKPIGESTLVAYVQGGRVTWRE